MRFDSSAFPHAASAGSHGPHIAVFASSGALFEGLGRIMENHVGEGSVILSDHVPEPADPDHSIRLVLFHESVGLSLTDCATTCRRIFPKAAIGLIIDDPSADLSPCRDLFERGLIQGLLPLNFKLDVCLAAVSLLLSGGEYYPHMHPQASKPQTGVSANEGSRIAPAGSPSAATQALNVADAAASQTTGKTLTARERQILELVSEGHQNKHIAYKMSLSEHTVKVHVHNLIGKLRVSNRTQAAAAFRAGGYGAPFTAVPVPPGARPQHAWTPIKTK